MDPSRLAAIPLFGRLDEKAVTALARVANDEDVPEGKTVVAKDDFGHAIYAIESGTADVLSEGGKVATLGPGDLFGEIAVVASGRRTASVVATSPMKLIVLFKRDVWALERNSPDTAAEFRRLIAERQAAQPQ